MSNESEDGSSEYRKSASLTSGIELSERIYVNNPSKLREEEHNKNIRECHENIENSHENVKNKYGIFNKYNKSFRKLKRRVKAKKIYLERCISQKYLDPLGSYFARDPRHPRPVLQKTLESNLY